MNLNSLLHVSRSGINGLQKHLDVTANNIANVNTTGYKEKQTSFRELLNNPTTQVEVGFPANTPNLGFNRGVAVFEEGVDFTQGSFMQTESPYDLAIQGNGFFGVRDANGQLLLTRDGNFMLDETGRLVNERGLPLEVNLAVPYANWPQGTPAIDPSGNISIVNGATTTDVGRVVLYQPENPDALIAEGENVYRLAEGSNLLNSNATMAGFGTIRQSALENANVNLAKTMTDLIATQRAYSLNTRVLQSTDELLSTVNRFTD
ncbi:flagellar hook-basal body protein [Enterococcus olivae]